QFIAEQSPPNRPNIQLNENKNRQNISEITPSAPLYIPYELLANEINEGPSNKRKNKNQQNITEITPSSPIYFPDRLIDMSPQIFTNQQYKARASTIDIPQIKPSINQNQSRAFSLDPNLLKQNR
ncbi:5089_t:CDS:1, partial [Dentiscutata erythropus]